MKLALRIVIDSNDLEKATNTILRGGMEIESITIADKKIPSASVEDPVVDPVLRKKREVLAINRQKRHLKKEPKAVKRRRLPPIDPESYERIKSGRNCGYSGTVVSRIRDSESFEDYQRQNRERTGATSSMVKVAAPTTTE